MNAKIDQVKDLIVNYDFLGLVKFCNEVPFDRNRFKSGLLSTLMYDNQRKTLVNQILNRKVKALIDILNKINDEKLVLEGQLLKNE